MAIRHNGLAALALAVLIASEAVAQTHSPEEIAADRREAVDRLFRPDYADVAVRERRLCFRGEQPKKVAKDRQDGAYFIPDPADTCIAALARLGRDRQLAEQYHRLVEAVGGDNAVVNGLPRAISDAAASGRATVVVGGGKGIDVTPSMAFDAGFTVAFQEGAATPTGRIDDARLKAVTESCLGDDQAAATCASVGYLQGARAFARQATAAR